MDLPACETFPPSAHVLAPAMWGEEAIYTWRDAPCVSLPLGTMPVEDPNYPPKVEVTFASVYGAILIASVVSIW